MDDHRPQLWSSKDGRAWVTREEALIQNEIIELQGKLHGIVSDREVARKLDENE